MKKEILLGMLVMGQITPTFGYGDSSKDNKSQEIFENFKDKNLEKAHQLSSDEVFEILQDNLRQQIINGVISYFDNDVTFKLTSNEKSQLKYDLSNYLNRYPNIIKIYGNKVILNLNDENFRELFKTLLPYLGKGKELSQYPSVIRTNSNLIINHVIKSKGEKSEKHVFHEFGYLIMRIVEQVPGDMTIGYYRQEMLKVIPNKYIRDKEYSQEILNSSITKLPKYF